jgi:transcriptional regulator with XRE-family HTH domain
MKYDRTLRSEFGEKSLGTRLGNRLATLRIAAKFTQHSLAARLRIGEKLYSSWETGKRTGLIQLRYLVRIANFYQLTLLELLSDDVEAKNAPHPRVVERSRSHGAALHSKYLAGEYLAGEHIRCRPGSDSMCAECQGIWSDAERATA